MRFVVTGGGTGGHIYPALAIAEGLKERYPASEILYIGKQGGLEEDIVKRAYFDFEPLRISGLERNLTFKNITVLLQAGKSVLAARKIIKKFNPSVVIGTGGYVCGPVVMAAVFLRIPALIHEQNALPGVTNKILSVFAKRVMLTFEEAAPLFPRKAKTKVTGLPVRPEIINNSSSEARQKLGIKNGELFVLSFGGSQGARSINKAMAKVLTEFQGIREIKFTHVTGQSQYEEFLDYLESEGFNWKNKDNITIVSYIYEMPEALSAADLVVSRAGAATLSEMTVRGVPCILIPYPYASENHQEYNARALADKGAAEMILDKELSGQLLKDKIEELVFNREKLQKMHEASFSMGKPKALSDILSCIEKYKI